MANFSVWDVISVPFPYTNKPVMQRRPALVVATSSQQGHPLLWALMITSAENRGWPDDVPIAQHKKTGLPVPSVIRTAKISTVEAVAAQRLGTLPENERAQVAEYLSSMLAEALNY